MSPQDTDLGIIGRFSNGRVARRVINQAGVRWTLVEWNGREVDSTKTDHERQFIQRFCRKYNTQFTYDKRRCVNGGTR